MTEIIAAPHIAKLCLYAAGKAAEGDAIVIDEADVPKRRSQLLYKKLLRRLTRTHRRTDVDGYMNGQVLLFEEELKEQLIEPSVNVPVHESQVVAGDIGPVVGEFHTLAATFRAALALELALQYPATKDIQRIQTRHKCRIQQFRQPPLMICSRIIHCSAISLSKPTAR